jgi:hypothetical protein
MKLIAADTMTLKIVAEPLVSSSASRKHMRARSEISCRIRRLRIVSSSSCTKNAKNNLYAASQARGVDEREALSALQCRSVARKLASVGISGVFAELNE